MIDLPDSDDPLSRTHVANPLFRRDFISFTTLTTPVWFEAFAPEVALVFALLLVSLFISALRAAYAATALIDAPWERKNTTDLIHLDRSQKLTLSVVQRMSTLLAFLLAARLLWLIFWANEDTSFRWIPIVILCFWLWCDALVRYYAGRNAHSFTQRMTPVVRPVLKLMAPLTRTIHSAGTRWGILLPEGVEATAERLEAQSDSEEERDLLRGLANFAQTAARQAMRPRLNITAFDIELDFHELMDKINKSGYSRVPVYRDTLDSVEGILYVKDLLPHLHRDEHFVWQKLLRQAYFIPESKRLDDLMQEFQNRRVHMAIVVDEYGGTSGLITLEDIIEEIFGDINDEYDEEEEVNFTQVDEKTFVFEGRAAISDFCRIANLDQDYFEEVNGNSESLAGLLLELFSRLPRTGDQVTFRDVTFKVQSADKKRIKKVRVLVA
ncbi:transporter associated domain-containing protein [Telluribacter humicola]|uniref:transporter associated domain-containing protein n=1 Tax=Telluribacter humicola TaxID=1720261 RepID=UPI00286E4FE1|nr:transporter associated domain-containing protein [Telluribacter humicola]